LQPASSIQSVAQLDTRRAAWLAVLLVFIASARIVSTYTVFNHTIDEPDHLAAGMEWLSAGKYLYEDQHPPLARVMGALGPYLAGERWHGGPDSYREGYRILGRDAHYDRTLALGRAGILPFFWIASAVVFLWGLRAAGASAALAATLLFTTLPPVLAHSGLIATDMAAAAWIGAAALASLYWVERPDWRRTVLFGAALGLACLSKFSALLFLPAALLLIHRAQLFRHRRSLAAACALAFLVIWAGYRFSFARVEYLHLRLPAPRFFTGLATLWAHNAAGHVSYLLGRRSGTGFWYYYPVVLAIKTPLAFLLLAGGAASAACRRSARLAAAMGFCAAILICALASRINIGVRHVLPIYVGLSVIGGGVAAAMLRRPAARWILAGLLLWQVASGALGHPDYLAYTNEIAGRHPENFVADSDLDWGQDMKRLADRLRRAGALEVTFSPFNRTYPALAGDAFPRMLPVDSDRPAAGWNAVSVSTWKMFGTPKWADRFRPRERIGRSILLWHFPSDGGIEPR
jgi:hypothetical protein